MKRPHLTPTPALVFSPSGAAGHALEEARHRFIGRSNLHLVEGRLVAVAAFARTRNLGFLSVIPGARSAKDVFPLLALVRATGEDRVGDAMLERACSAFESVRALVRAGDG